MIIELFGPPGSGKTTLALALGQRLERQGHATSVILSYRQGEPERSSDSGGSRSALGRAGRAFLRTLATVFRPRKHRQELHLANSLIWLLPPKSPVWMLRLWQYILRLSRCWKRNAQSSRVVIFDQAYLQAVCSLAAFTRAANDAALAGALEAAPQADLVVRLDAPCELLERRLRDRSEHLPRMEQFFDAGLSTSMATGPIADRIQGLLEQRGGSIIEVRSLDSVSLGAALDRIEQAVELRIGPAAKAPGDAPPPDRPAESEPEQAARTEKEPDLGKRMTSASAQAFALYVGGAVLTSLVQLQIARLIGTDGFGIFSYVLAWTSFLSYVATLGFHVAVLRFVPVHAAREEWGLVRGVVLFAIGVSTVASLILAAIGIAVIVAVADHIPDSKEAGLLIGMATIPAMTMYLISAALVRAFGGVVTALLPERIARDALLSALVAVMAALAIRPVDATGVLTALLVSSVLTACLAFVLMLRIWPAYLKGVRPAFSIAQWCATVLPMTVLSLLDVLMVRTGVILLGWLEHIREAGIFALGFSIATLILLPRVAVGTMFAPTAADLHARDDHAGLQRLFARAALLSFAVSGLLAAPLLIFMEPVLRFFGEDFVQGAQIARLLVLGQLIAAAMGPQQHLMTMTGQERAAALAMAISAALNVAGCLIGIKLFGAVGAALATTLVIIVWNIIMAVSIHRRLGLLPGLACAVSERLRSRAVGQIAAGGS
ncbi:MAG: polysaccharide biosynthesis C-terminal domain-containing protein [Phreatobacter sp.]|uniref:lipopolysaccharide biosynthesis protein n=1 Tax=Phreatobacter sp. TaxID=1966341 RepID=UPI001A4A08D8|nr:polysaccharide biosynthesis C-terminal domain-containing protein [Phreatobacter sp.]MBL8568668.1 polysaccharide biosynthesis C-terminal domain-containing protein [Phreatobacter sp.]